MRYIDTNVFGYAIENHPVYGNKCRKILEDIFAGKLVAGASVLVLVELIGVLGKINQALQNQNKKVSFADEF